MVKKPKAVANPEPAAEPQPKSNGRPVGSKTQKVIAEAHVSRCAKCGSTDRTAYSNTKVYPFPGTDREGHPYTHVVRRTTRCKACGQARIDRSVENRTGDQDLIHSAIADLQNNCPQ